MASSSSALPDHAETSTLRETSRAITIDDISAPYCEVCKAMLAEVIPHWQHQGLHCFYSKTCVEGLHHQSAKGLFIAAASGCGICTQIEETMTSGKDVNQGVRRFYDTGSTIKFVLSTLCLTLMAAPLSKAVSRWSVMNKLPTRASVVPEEYRSLTSEYTGSPEVLERAHSWLELCTSQHATCDQERRSDYHPPRLLLLQGDLMKLIDTQELAPPSHYAALSYCWGRNPRHLTLTSTNIQQLQEGIPISNLARTFQDAVVVTRGLKLHLLWIDALCILQSGPGANLDWKRHLSEMGDIYSNCWFNIAADHGESAEDGLFAVRNPEGIKLCTIDSQEALTTTNDSNTHAQKRILFDNEFWLQQLIGNPLLKKGWVYQERVLSPRILHFGKKQLLWECSAHAACETFPVRLPSLSVGGLKPPLMPFSLHEMSWKRIVEAYSQTLLTKPQDKLAALSGIARRFSQKYEYKYVAGLMMKDHHPQALSWTFPDGSRIIEPYRAPSWSWASREGRISMPQEQNYYRPLCSIDDIALDYASHGDLYGPIVGGFMVVSAVELDNRMILSVLDDIDTSKQKAFFPEYWLCEEGFEHDLLKKVELDHTIDTFEGNELPPRSTDIALIILYTDLYDTTMYGLILGSTESTLLDTNHVRIGQFKLCIRSREHNLQFMTKIRAEPKKPFKIF